MVGALQLECTFYSVLQITDVFVGSTRDNLLDRVCPDLSIAPVVTQFGKYVKIACPQEKIPKK